MKKVIVAAAGLMLVGAMVGSASAAVSLSGDARARGYYQTNYDFGAKVDGQRINELDQSFTSRVRIKFNADAKGGAYARVRVRMADSTWDGTRQTRDKGAGSNSYVDYAYIGVPMGPVKLEAGLMNYDMVKFFQWDNRADQAVLTWANDMTTLQVWYQKTAEKTDPKTDFIDDYDIDTWVGVWKQKFAGDFGMQLIGTYQDDQTPADQSGFTGVIALEGPAGPVKLEGAFAYQDADLTGNQDDGYGGYIAGTFDAGAAALTLNVGFVKDGYKADNDFGFIMIGGAASITPSAFDTGGKGIGVLGDTWWIGGTAGYKVSEALSVKGNLVYADVDEFGDLFEISGTLSYAISDGASFDWDMGYLLVNMSDDRDSDDPFGTAITFNVSF
jgi:hypothetical protein